MMIAAVEHHLVVDLQKLVQHDRAYILLQK